MTSASKSGSNTLHGGLFEFLRNDIFDARDPILPTRLPFRLNQFGGDLGGRLIRDRSFFYFTYEGLRQSYGQPLSGFVPSRGASPLRWSPPIRRWRPSSPPIQRQG